MNNILKGLRSVALTAVLVAALPLAASAMNVGVSNEIDSSITSGHVDRQSNSYDVHQGVEAQVSVAAKVESGTTSGNTSAYTVDPAASSSQTSGSYTAAAESVGVSQGTYASGSTSSSSLVGGSEQDTSLSHTVSAFGNP